MKRRSNRRWRRATALALAACIGAGLLVPGALAAEGDEAILIEGDPALTASSPYRANTYIVPSALPASAYEGLSTAEALDLARANGDAALKTFPVTLFNYDMAGFTASQHQADLDAQGPDLTEWKGVYFTTGGPGADSYYGTYTPTEGYVSASPTYAQLADADGESTATDYYIRTSDGAYEQVYVTRTSSTSQGPVAVPRDEDVYTINWRNAGNWPDGDYYAQVDEQWHYITGAERDSRTEGALFWKTTYYWYDIYGQREDPFSETAAEGLQAVQSSTGLSVTDIPVVSVDMGGEPEEPVEPSEEPETPEPMDPVEPSEEPETPEPTDPVEPSEEPETPEPTDPVEPSEEPETPETTEPVESAGPVQGDPGVTEQPGAAPEQAPAAPLATGTVIDETNESTNQYDDFTVGLTLYQVGTRGTYTYTLTTADGTPIGDPVTIGVDAVGDPYKGTALYEWNEGGQSEDVRLYNIPYAAYNFWTGFMNESGAVNTGNQTNYRGYVYGGLMEDHLDDNGDPVFTVPDAGIFTTDPVAGKEVFENVTMPFVYDSTTGYYEFNAAEDSAIFDGAHTMVWNDQPQYNSSGYGNGFYPFNDTFTVTESDADYHFGLRAEVPFTMTSDGQVNGQDIVFEFSGDDDVWVFVDGVLVLDLGGIHDSVDGSINFANGTVEYSSTEETWNDGEIYSGTFGENGSAGESEGALYAKLGVTGLEEFVAQGEHTLTIFYLERGRGASNCKIRFNLPQEDSLSVVKNVPRTDSNGDRLDDATWKIVNDTYFAFLLYNNDAPVADTMYVVTGPNGTRTGYTSAVGRFRLYNGETAKFPSISFTETDAYYVVEERNSAYEAPVWSTRIELDDDPIREPSGAENSSEKVTIVSSDEVAETLTFICTNTYTHVNTTTINATPDTIVVDYGLPVEIDVLRNDIITYNTGTTKLELVDFDSSTASGYGTAAVTADNKILYSLTQPLDQIVTFTYQVTATRTDISEPTSAESGPIKVTIIPATSMYYEQDFGDLVSTGAGAWDKDQTTPDSARQEFDPVGTAYENSPYGADVYYAASTGDSAGSVYVVDTSSSHAAFSYSFTGTGSAIFARLTKETGYMYVKVKEAGAGADGPDTVEHYIYRDTRVLPEYETGDPIYNIPVYEITGLPYGTYTVEVIIARSGVSDLAGGSKFYLDGIRIYDPIDPTGAYAAEAEDAYAQDEQGDTKVVQVRDKLINDYADVGEGNVLDWNAGMAGGNIFVTDTDGNLDTAEDYKTIGPKNELYLDPGQSVAFSLGNWDRNTGHLYLGIKALQGNGSVSINGNTIDVTNTVDQYVDITKYVNRDYVGGKYVYSVSLEVRSGGPVSLTNIKVTGSNAFEILEKPDNIDIGG